MYDVGGDGDGGNNISFGCYGSCSVSTKKKSKQHWTTLVI